MWNLGAFLDETDDKLQRLDDMLLALERNMVDMDVINEIFRAAHTLKGMAGTMGFTQMIPHPPAHHHRAVTQWKSRLEKASKGTRPLTESDMNLLFTGLDNLQAMADSIRGGGNDAQYRCVGNGSAAPQQSPNAGRSSPCTDIEAQIN